MAATATTKTIPTRWSDVGITEIRAKARGLLHRRLGRPAFYFPSASDLSSYVETSVRPHSKRGQIGDLPGTNLNYAEVIDRQERLVFWKDDVPAPARGAMVVLSSVEGYWVDTTDPADGQTVSVTVTKMTETELSGVPVPGGC